LNLRGTLLNSVYQARSGGNPSPQHPAAQAESPNPKRVPCLGFFFCGDTALHRRPDPDSAKKKCEKEIGDGAVPRRGSGAFLMRWNFNAGDGAVGSAVLSL